MSNSKRFAGKLYEVIIGVEWCSIKIANNHHSFKVSREDALLALHIDESDSKVIVPKEYYHMIDKVLVFS